MAPAHGEGEKKKGRGENSDPRSPETGRTDNDYWRTLNRRLTSLAVGYGFSRFSRCHAAAAFAKRRRSFHGLLPREARTYAALNTSPHPVGFAGATRNARALSARVDVKTEDPRPPCCTTTSPTPFLRI